MGRLTEGSIRTKSDRPEPDVEPLVVDDLGRAAVLGRRVCVGGDTCPLKSEYEMIYFSGQNDFPARYVPNLRYLLGH